MTLLDKTFPVFEQILGAILQLLEQLQSQLMQETDALANTNNADVINIIAANKKQLVQQLELFNTQLGQILSTESLPNNQDGISEYFRRAENHGMETEQVIADWNRAQLLCRACKQLNDQNGASILLLSRHNSRCLQLIKGNNLQTSTYGPKGQSQNELRSRPLISV